MDTAFVVSLLVIALGIAANPPGIVVQVGLLGSKNGVRKAFVYLAGLLASMVFFAVLAYLLYGTLSQLTTASAKDVNWGLHALGGLIVVGVGVWLWRQPAEAVGGFIGKALADLDDIRSLTVFILGFLLVNYVLEVTGALSIYSAKLSASQTAVAFVLFAVVATSTIWLPLALALFAPKRWAGWSGGIRDFVVRRGNALLGGLIAFIGVLILAQSVVGFLGR